jgi:hypothetical protein
MTTQKEIDDWFEAGVKHGATHMIVACDTFDHEDYPIYTTGAEETNREYLGNLGQNMQRVMEVYDLKADKHEQLNERRAMRLPS